MVKKKQQIYNKWKTNKQQINNKLEILNNKVIINERK